MNEPNVIHDTFVVERHYDVTPERRVFAAFADLGKKSQWFTPPEPWLRGEHTFEFREGGREHLEVGPEEGPIHTFDSTFCDIDENRRIVTTYEMALDGRRTSVSVATLELSAEGSGTYLRYTEQGAYLEGKDSPAERLHGTNVLFDKLAESFSS